MNIHRHSGKHHAGDAGKDEIHQPPQTEQHRRGKPQLAAPEGGDPGKHLDAGGHRDKHGGEHEQMAHPLGGAAVEHVMHPHDQAEHGDGQGGERHQRVAKERLARIHRKQLRKDAKHRQRHHIHRRMGIEPEEVLIKHRITTALRLEKAGAEAQIKQQHHRPTREHRQAHQLDDLGGEGGPAEDRHTKPAHARGPHSQDGGHEVDRPQDRGDPGEGHRHDPDKLAIDEMAQRVLGTYRRIGPPTGAGGPAGQEEAQHQQGAEQGKQPERQGIELGEGHVRRADHRWDQQVVEAIEDREQEQEQHHRSMHRVEAVVHAGIHQIRLGG